MLNTACRERENFYSSQDIDQALAWIAPMDAYGREMILTPEKYAYNWLDAVFLKAMIQFYESGTPDSQEAYFLYIKDAMDQVWSKANGGTPNDVASGCGLAFLYKVTSNPMYLEKAEKVFNDYQRIARAKNGGVSHVYDDIQLWDDTIYMIGMFLQEMYQATGDERYLNEYIDQLLAHAEVLADQTTGLWYHGWDEDGQNHSSVGSLPDWPKPATYKSSEFWGRGNGWVLMSLADALSMIGKHDTRYANLKNIYHKMVDALLPLQDPVSGHWFQLPAYPFEQGNYKESSCTAMFCYAITKGINLGILDYDQYFSTIQKGVKGLSAYSIQRVADNFAQPINVCVGTGIGDKGYYYNRPVVSGVTFAFGIFLMMGHEVQKIQKTKH